MMELKYENDPTIRKDKQELNNNKVLRITATNNIRIGMYKKVLV